MPSNPQWFPTQYLRPKLFGTLSARCFRHISMCVSALLCAALVVNSAAAGTASRLDQVNAERSGRLSLLVLYDGNKTPSQVFFSTVMIKTKAGFCTATLIDKRAILTAAHCLESPKSREQIEIWFQRPDEVPLGSRYSGEQFEVEMLEPDPSATHMYDLAVAKFKSSIIPRKWQYIKVDIPFVEDFESYMVGKTLYAAGTGKNEENIVGNKIDGNIVGNLRWVLSRYVKWTTRGLYSKVEGTSGLCDGDSGGPLYVVQNNRLLLIGVLSGTSGGLTCDRVGIYAMLNAAVYVWIEGILDGLK